MARSKAYKRALAGIARCNKRGAWYSPWNGYTVCNDCIEREPENRRFLPCSDMGPPESYGRCDRPKDGMGAASWPKRLAAQEV
jgi:hypothetical protein